MKILGINFRYPISDKAKVIVKKELKECLENGEPFVTDGDIEFIQETTSKKDLFAAAALMARLSDSEVNTWGGLNAYEKAWQDAEKMLDAEVV